MEVKFLANYGKEEVGINFLKARIFACWQIALLAPSSCEGPLGNFSCFFL